MADSKTDPQARSQARPSTDLVSPATGACVGIDGRTYQERLREVEDELVALRKHVTMQNAYHAARRRETTAWQGVMRTCMLLTVALLVVHLLLFLNAVLRAEAVTVLP